MTGTQWCILGGVLAATGLIVLVVGEILLTVWRKKMDREL